MESIFSALRHTHLKGEVTFPHKCHSLGKALKKAGEYSLAGSGDVLSAKGNGVRAELRPAQGSGLPSM